MTKIFEGPFAPNHKEYSYWIDTTEDPKGSVIKYYAGDSTWLPLSNNDADASQNEAIKLLQNTTKLLTTTTSLHTTTISLLTNTTNLLNTTTNLINTKVATLTSDVANLTLKINKLTPNVDEILVKTKEEYEALTPNAKTLYLIPVQV